MNLTCMSSLFVYFIIFGVAGGAASCLWSLKLYHVFSMLSFLRPPLHDNARCVSSSLASSLRMANASTVSTTSALSSACLQFDSLKWHRHNNKSLSEVSLLLALSPHSPFITKQLPAAVPKSQRGETAGHCWIHPFGTTDMHGCSPGTSSFLEDMFYRFQRYRPVGRGRPRSPKACIFASKSASFSPVSPKSSSNPLNHWFWI